MNMILHNNPTALIRQGNTLTNPLFTSDDGQLKPKMLIPEGATSHRLSQSLTEMVVSQAKAVWVNNQKPQGGTTVLQHYADALCVPLLDEGKTIGAIHLYLEKGRFRQSDFDVAIPVANILAVALVRAQKEALLRVDHRRLLVKAAVFDELVGDSKPMTDLKSKIIRIARATGCVLIRGESGVGKELVARAVHKSSGREIGQCSASTAPPFPAT
jgi:transcriptional regulator with GAF, ATPase, and Fis domain